MQQYPLHLVSGGARREADQERAPNNLRIGDVLGAALFGVIATNSEHAPFSVYVDAQNTALRSTDALVAVMMLDSLVSAFREYRCLASLADNRW